MEIHLLQSVRNRVNRVVRLSGGGGHLLCTVHNAIEMFTNVVQVIKETKGIKFIYFFFHCVLGYTVESSSVSAILHDILQYPPFRHRTDYLYELWMSIMDPYSYCIPFT